jgi:ribosomal protein L1
MGKTITYGLGGYDPTKPNNNIVEEINLPDEDTNEI